MRTQHIPQKVDELFSGGIQEIHVPCPKYGSLNAIFKLFFFSFYKDLLYYIAKKDLTMNLYGRFRNISLFMGCTFPRN